jgi:hypothetical protein
MIDNLMSKENDYISSINEIKKPTTNVVGWVTIDTNYLISSLNVFPALKIGKIASVTTIFSPVLGFTPLRS